MQPRVDIPIDWSKTDYEIFVAELDAGNWDNPLCDTVLDLPLFSGRVARQPIIC